MVSQSFILRLAAICAAVSAAPLPLNINLGAYSPAMVVGDGAIEFEGGASVESIISTLQGASSGARNNAAAEGGVVTAAVPAQGLGLGAKAVDGSGGILNEKAMLLVPGSATPLDPRDVVDDKVDHEEEQKDEPEVEQVDSAPLAKRQSPGFQAALAYAVGALTKGPKVQLGNGRFGAGIGIIVDNNAANGAKAAA